MFNTIARKIGGGYLSVILVLLISGGFVYWKTQDLTRLNSKLRDFRSPTVETSLVLLNGINESQAAVRGWLIGGEDRYLDLLDKSWTEDIDTSLAKLKDLSEHFKNPETTAHFKEIQKMLQVLRENQKILSKTKVAKASLSDDVENLLNGLPLRSKIEDLIDFQHGLMEKEAAAQVDLIDQLNILQFVLIFFGALTCLIMAIIVTRAVVGPIDKTIQFADAISSGDYKSKIEIGGSAEINRLKASLDRMRDFLEKQAWLSQARLHFNDAIRGVTNVPQLAEAALGALARFIGAEAGLLYVSEGEKLKVTGGYAYPEEWSRRAEVHFGEGVAGQAASGRKQILISEPDGGALPIRTLAGDIHPHQISASPLMLGENVVGVVEFASLSKMQDRDVELLNSLTDTMAISLESVAKNDQVKSLLHETQTQAEELQAQQEELKQSNDELQSRQEELESINEELEEQQSLLRTQKTQLDEKNHELEMAQEDLSAARGRA